MQPVLGGKGGGGGRVEWSGSGFTWEQTCHKSCSNQEEKETERTRPDIANVRRTLRKYNVGITLQLPYHATMASIYIDLG